VHQDHHSAGTVTSVATHKLNVGQRVEAWKASIQRGKTHLTACAATAISEVIEEGDEVVDDTTEVVDYSC